MKILLLDIETAPHKVYSWGLWKQNINIGNIVEPGYTLCWTAKWYKKRGTMFKSLFTHGAEDMINTIHNLLSEADAVITYNGDRFDLPTLNQEFMKFGLTPPAPYRTIDLIKTVRRNFRLASTKLDFVARHLGLEGKLQHKGMKLWRDCMAGEPKAWAEMERYNKRDVSLLEEVYRKLIPWIRNHPNYGVYLKVGRPVCTNCGSRKVQSRGIEHTKTLKYRRWHCQSCGTWMRGRLTISTAEDKEHVLV